MLVYLSSPEEKDKMKHKNQMSDMVKSRWNHNRNTYDQNKYKIKLERSMICCSENVKKRTLNHNTSTIHLQSGLNTIS